MSRPPGKCRICDGTGWWVLMNSWFPADGYRKERCGICGGTGFSRFHDSEAAASQRRLRDAEQQWKHDKRTAAAPGQAARSRHAGGDTDGP